MLRVPQGEKVGVLWSFLGGVLRSHVGLCWLVFVVVFERFCVCVWFVLRVSVVCVCVCFKGLYCFCRALFVLGASIDCLF